MPDPEPHGRLQSGDTRRAGPRGRIMPEEIFVLAIMSILSATALGFGLMRTVGRHLERKHGGAFDPAELQMELDELRRQLETVDDLRQRHLELEERLDFAERLLVDRTPRRKGE